MTADGPYLVRPVDLTALADRSGVVEWGRLPALVAGSDVVVGEVLDEELILCRELAGLPDTPDSHWTPYQWAVAPSLRSVAVRSGLALSFARAHPSGLRDRPRTVALGQ